MFKKTISNRIYEDLVKQIEQAIFEGQLKAGDKLPPQRELCDQFETSRGTVREALRVLEQKGLIDIKLGVNGGAIVKAPDAKPLAKSINQLILQQRVSLAELMEFHEGIQNNIAEIASLRATKASQAELKELLQTAEAMVAGGTSRWIEFINIDQEIHKTISKMTNNYLYQSILETIQENIMEYYKSKPKITELIMKENYLDLKNIINAICENDVIACKNHLLSHVRRVHQFIRNNQ